MAGFIFGNNTPWTYDQLQSKRKVAEALAASLGNTPRNVGEGLNAIGKALAVRGINKQADKRDAELKGESEAKWARAFGGYGSGGGFGGGSFGPPSGTWTPDAPGPKPTEAHMGMPDVASGGLSFGGPKADTGVAEGGLDFGSSVMTPQEMIIAGAEKYGLNPIDVATAISYETGGRFDPMISGPTTQWGTHRGLIQFGEPQAAQHGVDFSSPDAAWRSQLDPNNGAVWKYLTGAGVKPGMGLPEVYSAINAGSVGRMNASDANNGGAPGTVADKVAGMAPHREKAAQFLGGTWTPDPNAGGVTASAQNAPSGGGYGGGMDIAMLADLASDPYATPGQKAVVSALMQQQMQMMDPMYQMELQRAQLELAQLQNPDRPEPIKMGDKLVDPVTYEVLGDYSEPEPGFRVLTADEATQMGLPPGAYQIGPNNEIKTIGGASTSVTVNNGGVSVEPLGTEGQILVPDPNSPSGYRVEVAPGSKMDEERKQAAAATDRREDAKIIEADIIINAAQRARDAAKNRDFGAGGTSIVAGIPGIGGMTDSGEVVRQIAAIKANGSLAALQAMRANSPTGGALGNSSDKDLQLLADKAGALDPNSPNLERDIDDYERALLRTLYGPERGDAMFEETRKTTEPPADDGVPTFNPQTGEWE